MESKDNGEISGATDTSDEQFGDDNVGPGGVDADAGADDDGDDDSDADDVTDDDDDNDDDNDDDDVKIARRLVVSCGWPANWASAFRLRAAKREVDGDE